MTKPMLLIRLVLLAFLFIQPCCTSTRAPGSENRATNIFHRAEFTRLSMGVQCRIILYACTNVEAQAAAQAAFDRIAQLDAIFSDYRPVSEAMRLCEAYRSPHALPGFFDATRPEPPPRWTILSPDLFHVLTESRRISETTLGAFDCTIGALSKLWRDSRGRGEVPDAAAIETLRRLTGWRLLEVDERRHAARLLEHGVMLDFGGIAKGYAAQQAVELLKALGHSRCLVALAGDIAIGDPPPDEAGWRIDVAHGPDTPIGHLILHNCAVSTSGDSEQHTEIGGVRYSHILDARTGVGVTNGTAATIIAPRGELADAFATACCILGEAAALDLVSRDPRLSAIISIRGGNRSGMGTVTRFAPNFNGTFTPR